jgi:hypothetical protein
MRRLLLIAIVVKGKRLTLAADTYACALSPSALSSQNGMVHCRGSDQVFHGLLARANPPMQLAEAEVAVGDERAHAELVGECQPRGSKPPAGG